MAGKKKILSSKERCEKCGYDVPENKSNYMPCFFPGYGEKECKILFIGESPGTHEDKKDEPFVGKAGIILKKCVGALCEKYGVDPEEIAYTNIARCRKFKMEEGHIVIDHPTITKAKGCSQYAVWDILKLKPKIIVTLGRVSSNGLLKSRVGSIGIKSDHGSVHIVEFDKEDALRPPRSRYDDSGGCDDSHKAPVVVSWHPSGVQYDGGCTLETFFGDLDHAFGQLRFANCSGEQGELQEDELIKNMADSIRKRVKYGLVTGASEMKNFYDYAKKFDVLACDIETSSLNPLSDSADILGVSFSGEKNVAAYIKLVDEKLNRVGDYDKMVTYIKKLITDPNIQIVGHHYKFDFNYMKRIWGINSNMNHDTMIANYCVSPDNRSVSLKSLARTYSNIPNYEEPANHWFSTYNNSKKEFWKLPDDILTIYAAGDADATLQCHIELQKILDSEKNINIKYGRYLYNNIMNKGNFAVGLVEHYGIGFDVDTAERYKSMLEKKLEIARKELKETPEVKLYLEDNPKKDSADFKVTGHIAKIILFDKRYLGLKPLAVTEKGNIQLRKAEKEILIERYPDSVFVQKFTEYFRIESDINNHLKKALSRVDVDGRIHGNISLTEVATGRLKSTGYNVQGVPRRKDIRGLFYATGGRVFVEADYKQAEMRVAAEMTNDENLIRALTSGSDMYVAVAADMLEVSPEEITKEIRNKYKAGVLSLIYGVGEKTLSQTCGISTREAGGLIREFNKKYPDVKKWQDKEYRIWESTGYVYGPTGRIRKAMRHTQAINSPVQATSSDVCLVGAYNVSKYLEDSGHGFVVNIVHDSVGMELHKDYGVLEEALPKIYDFMVNPGIRFTDNMRIKLDVDFNVGYRWGTANEYSLSQVMDKIKSRTLFEEINWK